VAPMGVARAQEAPATARVTLSFEPIDAADPGSVTVKLRVAREDGGTVAVGVQLTADGGRTWVDLEGLATEGLTNLRASKAGITHALHWNALADLGATDQKRVRLRARAPGAQDALSERFEVNARGTKGRVRFTRYPHVQNVQADYAVICWRTKESVRASVRFGLTPDLDREAKGPADGRRRHEVSLRELPSGQRIYYRVFGDGAALGPIESFRSARAPGDRRFTFAVVGDTGKGSRGQYAVAERIREVDPEFVIHTGDVIYPSGAAEDFDPKFFAPYRDILRGAPFFLSLGNHDIMTWLGGPYLDSFVLPRNRKAKNERFYRFDWGGVRLFALDSSIGFIVPDGKQVRWLDKELAKKHPGFRIAYFHHPPYSSGFHGSNWPVRSVFGKRFEDRGVELVFSGHDHSYERLHPIGGKGKAKGTTYVVTGGGGAGIRDIDADDWTAVCASVHHFVRVDVDGDRMTLTAIAEDGAVIDRHELTR
ncbi:MAG: metallophosphoesterase family protein, partial [Planctomycetota bacterium]